MSPITPASLTERLPAGALASASVGAMVAIAVAWGISTVLATTPLYFGRVAVVFIAMVMLALSGARRHHRHARFGAANHVTMMRAALVAVVAGGVGEAPTSGLALTAALLGAAGVTLDGVDGWLARRSGLASDFGARFDMEVDALLILALCVVAWRHDKAGAWVLTSGLLRYAFVAAGWVWTWMRRPLQPSKRRQTTCVLQILALLVVLSPWVLHPWSHVVAAASVAILCYSFFIDVRWLWHNATRPQTAAT